MKVRREREDFRCQCYRLAERAGASPSLETFRLLA